MITVISNKINTLDQTSYDEFLLIPDAFEIGKLYAITGKSGSGKITLLSLMGGLDYPLSGEVRFMGKSTKDLNCNTYRRDSIAVIYQNYNLFPHLTVMENIISPLILQKKPMKEANKVAKKKIDKIGLKEEHYKRYPSMLSGGEQQRVAIARALATQPEIILADEPTGNLDKENSDNIVDILSKLAHDENVCVIIVTHDSSVSMNADITLQMSNGKLLIGSD